MASVDDSGMDRFFIGGGASHTPEAMRRLLYSGTDGAEGISSPGDLIVRPLTVPGQGIRVAIGGALLRSRYIGGETQTYQASVIREQVVSTSPTGSSGGRSDLVILRIEDPFATGSPWSEPATADIPDEQYAYVRVISGVPAGTTTLQSVPGRQNDTGIALARIDFPANTGTVTTGMIKDLRKLSRTQRDDFVFARPRIARDNGPQNYLTAKVTDGGEYFPGGGGYENEFQVNIPSWCTHIVIDATWMAVNYGNDRRPIGRYWVEFGNEYKNHTWPEKRQYECATQQFRFNASRNNAGSTTDWRLMDECYVPLKLRGKRVTVVFKAGVENTPGANHTFMDALSGLGCRITFKQIPLVADVQSSGGANGGLIKP